MGGVVLKNDIKLQCYYEKSKNHWSYYLLKDVIEKPDLLESVAYVKTRASVRLYDFSGTYEVFFDDGEVVACSDVKEGSVIYVVAKGVRPTHGPERFYLQGESIIPQNDIASFAEGERLYARDDPNRDFYSRNEIREIRKTAAIEDVGFLGEFDADLMKVARFFLRKDNDAFDHYWLVETLYSAYRAKPRKLFADLMVKYFNFWWESQNTEALDREKYFIDAYHDMKEYV